MIALVQPWTPGQTWALLLAVIAIAALVSLALCRLMARHTRPADDGRIYRYGQGSSLSWAGPDNDEDPAAAKQIRVFAANPREKEDR